MRNFCAFENRPHGLPGMKLLILSLEEHCTQFTLYLGVLKRDEALERWLEKHGPHVEIVLMKPFITGASLKHVKPVLILQMLDRGVRDVTWIDTDMMALGDLSALLQTLDEDTLLVAQDMDYKFEFSPTLLEHYQMRPLRRLDFCVNTCVLRVTDRHRPLIEKLLQCLLDPVFVEEQSRPAEKRTPAFAFEQKILELLLCAGNEAWSSSAPVRFLPEGVGVIQELGVTTYSLSHRLLNGLGFTHPWFVHIPGAIKPWDPDVKARGYRGTSVYSAFAEKHKVAMEEDMSWVNSAGFSSLVARGLFFGVPHWMGWAHCLAGKVWRLLRTGTMRRQA